MIQDWPKDGKIEEISFSGLTVDTCIGKFTGTLRVEKETVIKVIYFKNGTVAYASSNENSDKLGSVLVNSGKITEAQCNTANQNVSGNKTLGKVLIEMGILSPDELLWCAKKQVEQIFISIFAWSSGSYELISDSLPEGLIDLKIKTESLIYKGIREIKDNSLILSEVGEYNSVYNFTENFMEIYENLHVDEHVDAVIANIDGVKSLTKLAETGGETETDIAKIIYFCKLFNLVQKVSSSQHSIGYDEKPSEPPFFVDMDDDKPENKQPETTPESPAWIFPAKDSDSTASSGPGLSYFSDPEDNSPERILAEELIIPKDERDDLGPMETRKKTPMFKAMIVLVIILAVTALGTAGWHAYNYWLSSQKIVDDFPPMKTDKFFDDKKTLEKNAVAKIEAPAELTSETGITETIPPPVQSADKQTETAKTAELKETAPPPAEKKETAKTEKPVSKETPEKPVAKTPEQTIVKGSSGFSECSEFLSKGDYESAARSGLAALKDKPSGSFTIQLELVCDPKNVLKAFEASSGSESFFIVPTSFKGRSCYKICWGIFSTKSEAEKAVDSLPGFFTDQDNKPQIITLKNIK